MKSYKEMSENVLNRRDEYKEHTAKYSKIIRMSVSVAASVCLIAAVGFGANYYFDRDSMPVAESNTSQHTEGAASDSQKNTDHVTDETPKSESTVIEQNGSEVTAAEDFIFINNYNSTNDESKTRALYALMWDDFVSMTEDELCEYYGINVFPEVPDDLKKDSGYKENYGIFRRENGTGIVYHDQNVINYSNEDFSRSVNVEIAKGQFPFTCIAFWEYDYFKPSSISNEEVYIAQSQTAGYYYIEFMYENTGFRIITEGLSEEEIIYVVKSIII